MSYSLEETLTKNFVTLRELWLLKEWGRLSESVKKGKFVTKNEGLKTCEK